MAIDPKAAAAAAQAAAEAARAAAEAAAQAAAAAEQAERDADGGPAPVPTNPTQATSQLLGESIVDVDDQLEGGRLGEALARDTSGALSGTSASHLGADLLGLPDLAGGALPGGSIGSPSQMDLTFEDAGPTFGKDAVGVRTSDGISADEVYRLQDIGDIAFKQALTPLGMLGDTTIGSVRFQSSGIKTYRDWSGTTPPPAPVHGGTGEDDTWSDGDGQRSNDGAPLVSTGLDAAEVTEFFEGIFGSVVGDGGTAGTGAVQSGTGQGGAGDASRPAPDEYGGYTGSWQGVTAIGPGSGDDDLVAGATGNTGTSGGSGPLGGGWAVNPGSEGTMDDVGRETELRDAKEWYGGGVGDPGDPTLEMQGGNPEVLDQGIPTVDPNTTNPGSGEAAGSSDGGAQASTAYRIMESAAASPEVVDAAGIGPDTGEPIDPLAEEAGDRDREDRGRAFGQGQGRGHGKPDRDDADDAID